MNKLKNEFAEKTLHLTLFSHKSSLSRDASVIFAAALTFNEVECEPVPLASSRSSLLLTPKQGSDLAELSLGFGASSFKQACREV